MTAIVSWPVSAKPSVTPPFTKDLPISFTSPPIMDSLPTDFAFATLPNDLRSATGAANSNAACGVATASDRNAKSASGALPASIPSAKFCPASGTYPPVKPPATAPRLNVYFFKWS